MNLGQARALVRDYINEQVERQWTDAKLNALVQEANRQIYLEVCNTGYGWFAVPFVVSYPAGQSAIDFWSLVPTGQATIMGELVRILGIYRLQTLSAIGPGNVPSPLKPYFRISDMYASDSQVGEYVQGYAATQRLYGYVTLGAVLCVWPVPQETLPLLVYAVPMVATPVVDADNLLCPWKLSITPQLTHNHELIPMLAAIKAKTQVGDPDNGLSTLYANRLKAMKDAIAMQQQIQDPAQVRGVGR